MNLLQFGQLSKADQIGYLNYKPPVAIRMQDNFLIQLYNFQDFYVELLKAEEIELYIYKTNSSDELDFNEVFFEKGGLDQSRLVASHDPHLHLRESWTGLFTFIKKRLTGIPNVYFDFINSPIVNGSATKFNGKFFIGINSGVHLIFFDLFTKLFSSKHNLPQLGISSVEADENFELSRILNNGISFDTLRGPFVLPRDSKRRLYAMQYFYFALDFMLLHEIAHIYLGHVGFINNKLHQEVWSEISYENNLTNNDDSALSQSFEIEADIFATVNFFLATEGLITNPNTLPIVQKEIFKSTQIFLEHWIFAIYCQFRIFDFKSIDIQSARKFSHPPTTVRIYSIIFTLQTLLQKSQILQAQKIILGLYEVIETAEKSFSSMTYNQNRFDVFISNFHLANTYLNEIKTNIPQAKAAAAPYAYF